MNVVYKNGKDLINGISLVTSILVRYPEVLNVEYNPAENEIKLKFLISRQISPQEVSTLKKLLSDSIEVYNKLKKRPVPTAVVSIINFQEFIMIEIIRDLETLVQEEISLIVQTLQQAVGTAIIAENVQHYEEEDLQYQEDMIDSILNNTEWCQEDKTIFAFREEGRVMVYNIQ